VVLREGGVTRTKIHTVTLFSVCKCRMGKGLLNERSNV